MAEPQKWWEDPIYDFAFKAMETSFTGFGEDGVLQPSNPVDVVQTNQGPKMLHEGEIRMVKPDGSMAVVPANQASQGALRQMEAVGKVGGYEAGVDFSGNPINKPAQTAIDTGLETLTGYAQGKSPYQRTLANQTMTNAGATAAAANAGLKMDLAQSGADRGTIGTAMQVANRDTASNLSKLSGQLALGAQQEQLGAASTAAGVGQSVKAQNYGQMTGERSFEYGKMTQERAYSDQEQARITSDIASGMTYQAFSLVHPGVSEADFNARRTYTAAGQTDVQQAEKNWTTAISAADLTNPTTVKTLQDLYAKQHPGLPVIDLAGLTRDQQYVRTKQGQEITTGGLSIQALSNQIGNTQAEAAVKALNDGVPVATVNATYGTKLTEADATSITTEYRQRVKTTGLSITALENQIGNTQASQAINALNSGMPVDKVNATYGTNLTQADADSITAEYRQRLQTGALNIQSIQANLDTTMYETLKDKIANGMSYADIQADPTLAGKITKAQFDYMASVRDVNLEGLKNTLTREVFNTIKEQIDANMTLDQVNASLPEGKKLSQQQYDALHQVAQISLDSMRQTLTEAKYDAIRKMVDTDSTFEAIVAKYPDFTMKQFLSMRTVHDLDLQGVRQSMTADKYAAVSKMVEDGMSLATINLAYPGALNQAEYDAMNEVRKINIEELKLKLKEDTFNAIVAEISTGAEFGTVNANHPGMFTQSEFEAIRRYSEAGRTDFTDKLNLATTQFSSGDIKGASATLQALFPTAKLDFSKLTEAQQRTDFYDGLSALADFSQMTGTFDELFTTIEKSGAFKQMGIDTTTTAGKAQARDLFDDYRVAQSPIGQMINSIDDASMRTLWPEETATPEGLAKTRRNLSLFMLSGGVTTDADGDMVISPAFQELWGELSGESDTPDTTYSGVALVKKDGDMITFKSSDGTTFTKTLSEVQQNATLSGLAGEKYDEGLVEYNTFKGELDEGITVSQAEWIAAGKPKTYEGYLNAAAKAPTLANLEAGTVSTDALKGMKYTDPIYKALLGEVPVFKIETSDTGYTSANAIGAAIQNMFGVKEGYATAVSNAPIKGKIIKLASTVNAAMYQIVGAAVSYKQGDSTPGGEPMGYVPVKDLQTGVEWRLYPNGQLMKG